MGVLTRSKVIVCNKKRRVVASETYILSMLSARLMRHECLDFDATNGKSRQNFMDGDVSILWGVMSFDDGMRGKAQVSSSRGRGFDSNDAARSITRVTRRFGIGGRRCWCRLFLT